MAGRVTVAPKAADFLEATPAVTQWAKLVGDRMSLFSGTADPTVSMVPENQWIIFYNTTLTEVRIWTNVAGTLKKSAAFT
jgi:hypothetical protein